MADIPQFTQAANLAKGDAPAKAAPKAEAPKVEAPKAPPRSMFTGTMKKLDVFGKPGTDPQKPIPGHTLYWFDDSQGGMYVTNALASGYRFVTRDEVAMNDAIASPGNTALDEKVRALVGSMGNEPVYSYLMAIPDELYKEQHEGPDSIEQRVHMKQEEQLAMGTYRMGGDDGRYTAANLPQGVRGSNLPAIKIGRYYRPPKPTL